MRIARIQELFDRSGTLYTLYNPCYVEWFLLSPGRRLIRLQYQGMSRLALCAHGETKTQVLRLRHTPCKLLYSSPNWLAILAE